MTSFHIAPEAAQDIEEIVEYIAKDSITAPQKGRINFSMCFAI